MAGSVFFTVLTLVAIIAAFFFTPFTLIPALVFLVMAVISGGFLKKQVDSAVLTEPAPTGTTTTADASYDPAGRGG